MFATTHVIIGGVAGVVVGNATQNPYAAAAASFGVGVVSHLLADCLPHIDAPFQIEYKDGKLDQPIWTKGLLMFAVLDSVVAFLLTLFTWVYVFDFNLLSPYAWGAFGAYLPDFVDVVPFWSSRLRQLPGFKQFHRLHMAAHEIWRHRYHMNKHWKLGVLTQVVSASLAIVIWISIRS